MFNLEDWLPKGNFLKQGGNNVHRESNFVHALVLFSNGLFAHGATQPSFFNMEMEM